MKILSLADGSSVIGSGHVTRSLVLARELHDRGHEVTVAGTNVKKTAKVAPSFGPLRKIDCRIPFDTSERIEIVREMKPDLVILDGYDFPLSLFNYFHREKIGYGIIDDYGNTKAIAPRFILNQNPHARKNQYTHMFPGSELLLGLSYGLIRREFRVAATSTHNGGIEPYVMVAFGGADVKGLTFRSVKTLAENGYKVKVALGNQISDRASVLAKVRSTAGATLIRDGMYEKNLANAKMSVLAAGSSLWEALYCSVPTVGVVVAENQVQAANEAARIYESIRVFDSRCAGFERNLLQNLRELSEQINLGGTNDVIMEKTATRAAKSVERFSPY